MILSLSFASSAQAAWSFDYRKTITIDSSEVTADLTDFPVLISLTGDMDLRTVGDGGDVQNANGYDINFRASDGTMLDFEIEEYTSTAGGATLIAWVRIPNLSSSVDTDIYIYYGNDGVLCSQENPAGVWIADYEGVWHLRETVTDEATDSTGPHIDSTSNSNDGN
jgi:hypothetical protein